jgi:thiamine pyrophosphokinase
MNRRIVESSDGVTLVGGAPVTARALRAALRLAPCLVAADGGADRALRAGLLPQAVIGDFDSIGAAALAAMPPDRLHRIAEQETTDFDKALRSIAAPFVLALGFAGARIDHGLAVFNALARHPDRRCIVVGPQDAAFLCPPAITLRLRVGDRLSLFPMGPVSGESSGLRWPAGGIRFAPDGMIGTSNMVSLPQVHLAFDAPRMLVILPRARLRAVLSARPAGWPPPTAAAAP